MSLENQISNRVEIEAIIHDSMQKPKRMGRMIGALAVGAGVVSAMTFGSETSALIHGVALSTAFLGGAIVRNSANKAINSAHYEIDAYAKKHNSWISPAWRTQLSIIDGDLVEENVQVSAAVVPNTKINHLFALPLTIGGLYVSTGFLENPSVQDSGASALVGLSLVCFGAAAVAQAEYATNRAEQAFGLQLENVENRLPPIASEPIG